MGGYKNRILRVNLSGGTFSEETLSTELIHDYIGGRGFGVKMLYDDLKPGTDPLGEENELIYLAGPLTGTRAQAFSRLKVFFKSPLTGTYFKSAAGGHFAPEMKWAGFDAIIVKGIADKPVYLWIHDGKYELRDATYLWGLTCSDTHTLIREELHDPNVRIACIGPAGENLVKYAGIFTDRRAAGRGGGGTVMGAKNLKAVAVRGHNKPVEVADSGAFREAVKGQIEAVRTNPRYEYFSNVGSQHADFTIVLGMFPVKNFREGVLSNWESLDTKEFTKLRVRDTACESCMIHCGSILKVKEGKYKGAWSEGPEYETIWGFTGPIACNDINLTIAGDHVCDELGLDTISATGAIGFAYELYERGIITKSDLGGMELIYGNDEHVLEMLRQIAYREDFGDVLADGVREAARRIGKGSEQYAMHVKGMELPGYDPRGAKAHGLNLMTMNIGADHNSGYSGQEIFGATIPRKVDRFAVEGKGELCKWNQDHAALREVGVHCGFGSMAIKDNMSYGELLRAATGVKDFADPDYLWYAGEKLFNLERMFNVREGFDHKDDVVPARFTSEPMPSGPSKGQIFEAGTLLRDYYMVRGWDIKTGIPTAAKLEELGLGFAAIK
ncbi:aldehyde ferredoxin oxidoreductase family protein [Chloroflexota bacterium]